MTTIREVTPQLVVSIPGTSATADQAAIVSSLAQTAAVGMSQDYSDKTKTVRTGLVVFKEEVLKAIEINKDQIQQVINEQGYLVISDLGCFDGGNFFESFKEIIKDLRARFGNDFTIKVEYSDLGAEAGGFTKNLVENPELLGENVEVKYRSHNFYEKLPYQSNITFCTLGVHWLSKTLVTSNDPNVTLFPTFFEKGTPLHRELTELADRDMATFFKQRKSDTNIFLAMANMTKYGEGDTFSCTARSTMLFMDRVFREMNQDRGVTSGYVPFYYRTAPEYLAQAESSGFELQRESNRVFPCNYVKLFQERKMSEQELATAETAMARAWSEWSIKGLLKEHTDEFYTRLYGYFQTAPATSGSDYHLQNVILKPLFPKEFWLK